MNTLTSNPSQPATPLTAPFSSIEPVPLRFLWHPYLPQGKITLLLGESGAGKSLLSLYIASQLSSGAPLGPLPNPNPLPADSLLLYSDDDPLDTICPRLSAFGADLNHIHALPSVQSFLHVRPTRHNPTPRHAFHILQDALEASPAIKLLIIDSLPAFLGGRDRDIPTPDPAYPRTLLLCLARLAAYRNIAILATSRLTRNVAQKALYRAAASHPFAAVARSLLLLTSDPREPDSDRRLLVPLKHNLTARPSTLSFRIQPADPPGNAPTLQWDSAPLSFTPSQFSALAPATPAAQDSLLQHAVDWLASALGGGPQTASLLALLAARNSIARRTLIRAKQQLRVESVKEGLDKWWWKLPTDTTPVPPPSHKSADADPRDIEKMLASITKLGNLLNEIKE
jgi:hypothetical protein